MNNQMSDEILNQIKGQAFGEGVAYALQYLTSLYDGLEQTDLWKDYAEYMEAN